MRSPTEDEKEEMQLHRCVRIMPQDNNTGGFFVAVLRKSNRRRIQVTKTNKKEEVEELGEEMELEEVEVSGHKSVEVLKKIGYCPTAAVKMSDVPSMVNTVCENEWRALTSAYSFPHQPSSSSTTSNLSSRIVTLPSLVDPLSGYSAPLPVRASRACFLSIFYPFCFLISILNLVELTFDTFLSFFFFFDFCLSFFWWVQIMYFFFSFFSSSVDWQGGQVCGDIW